MSFFENFKKCPPTLWVLLGICSIKKVTAPPVTFHSVQSQRLQGKLILLYPFLERRCEENSVGLCDEERFAAILLSLNSLDIPIHFKVSSVSILIWNIWYNLRIVTRCRYTLLSLWYIRLCPSTSIVFLFGDTLLLLITIESQINHLIKSLTVSVPIDTSSNFFMKPRIIPHKPFTTVYTSYPNIPSYLSFKILIASLITP